MSYGNILETSIRDLNDIFTNLSEDDIKQVLNNQNEQDGKLVETLSELSRTKTHSASASSSPYSSPYSTNDGNFTPTNNPHLDSPMNLHPINPYEMEQHGYYNNHLGVNTPPSKPNDYNMDPLVEQLKQQNEEKDRQIEELLRDAAEKDSMIDNIKKEIQLTVGQESTVTKVKNTLVGAIRNAASYQGM
eukprot:TRINITY_DN543_c0_g1_i1.p1 TRINITY_DN543_c0_g1~~TRINITY_DN543_c0_g1_i1.p1  ORF type:complete len:189 (+),score=43.85 TRINITY_DN543_c0_g1_i1:42-608(+)